MSDKMSEGALRALKIAFTYMPRAIEVTRYDYGDWVDTVLAHIKMVRVALLAHGIDPEEVYGEVNPDNTPNSCY